MSEAIWDDCVSLLQNELPAQQFNTWIRPLQVTSEDPSTLTLVAPNRFVMDWVNDKYRGRIEELVTKRNEGAPIRKVKLLVAARKAPAFQTQQAPVPVREELPVTAEAESSEGFTQNTVAPNTYSRESRNFDEDLYKGRNIALEQERSRPRVSRMDALYEPPINLNNYSEDHSNIDEYGAPVQRVTKKDVEGGLQHKSNLNTGFTFDSFVVGKSNQLGLAAASQVAENPGGSYNPLFIYGGVGLGKTHLMHAVGNALIQRKPGAKVVYLHSERFVADMVKALQLNAINDFKRYYRSVDALLIDDIQFFAGKERSQEEFFHTFNALLEGGQQIILTCDRYPKEINGLEERLKSRFGWGLTVAIEPPELETRVAILKRKAESAAMHLPNDAAFFIAQRIRSNVRELEGALKRVIANAHFTGREITTELVREALKDLLALQDRLVSIDNIQRVVAEYYKIKVSDLHSKRRSRSVARPRQVAMYLAKDLTHHSLPEIGEAFGGRDHTTVLHACRKINELQESDADIREDVKNLLRTLTT